MEKKEKTRTGAFSVEVFKCSCFVMDRAFWLACILGAKQPVPIPNLKIGVMLKAFAIHVNHHLHDFILPSSDIFYVCIIL